MDTKLTSNSDKTDVITNNSNTETSTNSAELNSTSENSNPENQGMRHSMLLRFLAIILSFIGACLVFSSVFFAKDIVKTFESTDFLKSNTFLSERANVKDQIVSIYQNYVSEDYIKTGKFLDYETVNSRIQEIKDRYASEFESINENYRQWIENDSTKNDKNELARLTKERDELIKSKQLEAEKEIAGVKPTLINERIAQFEATKKSLGENKDVLYSVYIDKLLVYGPDASTYNSVANSTTYKTQINDNKEMEVYIGYTPEAYNKMKAAYEAKKINGLTGLRYLLGGCLLCLLGLIWLIYAAGKFNFLDRIYLDVAAVIILCTYAAYVALIDNIGGQLIREYVPVQAFTLGGLFALLYLLTPWFCVTAVKRLKNRSFLKSTLAISVLLFLIKIASRLWNGFKGTVHSLTNSDKLSRAVVSHFGLFLGACLGLGVLTILLASALSPELGLLLGFLLFIAMCAYFAKMIIGKLKSIETLAAGVKNIKSGDLAQTVPMTGVALIDNISSDVNNLADGLKIALRNEVRAEHMKVELVTNVSHDLKTPLTSIINYVDLLSKENLTPEKANEYVAILQSKSARLKHLVEDLFEVSKANSGTVTMNIEPLSLNELLSQAVGEYEDKFREKNLDLRLSFGSENSNGLNAAFSDSVPKNKLMIKGDSARMWRVLSNLLDNVVKFSMDSTRVYITCDQDEKFGWISIKNISSYEMNFPADEITERFKQGDESRSGEGSGLGLAIVKSFMKLQGGTCEITVDGDLFKVLVKAPLA